MKAASIKALVIAIMLFPFLWVFGFYLLVFLLKWTILRSVQWERPPYIALVVAPLAAAWISFRIYRYLKRYFENWQPLFPER
ncbi:MAG: hypothetical protein LAN64_14045 [Acidobacteriia bacterium]|nr:hypothetical protein [Terriglobia bacterium]